MKTKAEKGYDYLKKKFAINSPYVLWGLTALSVIVAAIVIFLGATHWRAVWSVGRRVGSILSPVIYGLFLAYLLNKPMNFFERTVFRRLRGKTPRKTASKKRIASLSTVMFIMLFILVGAVWLLVLQVPPSVERLVSRLPAYFNDAMEWVRRTLADNPELESALLSIVGEIEHSLTDWLKTTILAQINTLVTTLTTGVIGVIGELINVFIGFVVAVYVLYHRETFAAQTKKLMYAILRPGAADGLLRGCKFLDFTCGSFITSRLIDALIVGLVCYVALVIANIPYAVLISVIVGITNIIPFFGPFIGAVPCGLLLLLENPTKCFIFIVIIIILQQLDGNVLYPRIQGTSLGLSGFWILFAILLFGGLFGFIGFLLGVPVFAVIYSAVKHFTNTRLEAKGMPVDTTQYKDATTPEPRL